jgi:predicted nucleic acid-binding protein
MMKVALDASPLIVLCKAQLAHLLPALFAELLIPDAVWDEVMAGGAADPAAQQLSVSGWAKRMSVSVTDPIIITWNLGAGESEVLSLAQTVAGARAMIDDAAARNCARTLKIPFIGTGGLLVQAKRQGLIVSVADGLQAVTDAGLWLSESMKQLLRQQAGE